MSTLSMPSTQYSNKQLLKCFGKKGETAVQKQLQQFHDRRVFDPNNPRDLTYEQQSKSLAYLIFLKLRNDKIAIKVRGFIYGRKQQN